MSKKKAIAITGILTLVLGLILFYLWLPPLNIKSELFWVFLVVIITFAGILLTIFYKLGGYDSKRTAKGFFIAILILLVVFTLGKLSSSVVLRSRSYSNLISGYITEHDFGEYSATIDNVPLLDKASAMNIANRKLGGLQDVISQYDIDDTEQITVRGEPTRVACLNHASFLKWFNNRHDGTPGYIKIDMNSQEAELIRVKGGIKYSKSDYFFRDINRYLRVNYPSKIFWESTLELNEDDHPYWVTPVLDKTIGLFGGTDVSGAVLVDAVTGQHSLYDLADIPEWVDNVYGSKLLLDQYDMYGMYQNGFLNSRIGQKGVKRTTEGYNYIPQGDDNWIYTGITSVGKDESNIGFVLINKRTKETHLYNVTGAEEFSAMDSAEGAVQHLGYKSTFPLLLKIQGQPTYLVSLKDSGGLVKMYGMINVEKYQLVATASSINETLSIYKRLLKDSGASQEDLETIEISGKIEDIKEAVVDGNSNYFVKLTNKNSYYLLDIVDNKKIALLEPGDYISLQADDSDDDIIPARLID